LDNYITTFVWDVFGKVITIDEAFDCEEINIFAAMMPDTKIST
jgi:hypothetical protein